MCKKTFFHVLYLYSKDRLRVLPVLLKVSIACGNAMDSFLQSFPEITPFAVVLGTFKFYVILAFATCISCKAACRDYLRCRNLNILQCRLDILLFHIKLFYKCLFTVNYKYSILCSLHSASLQVKVDCVIFLCAHRVNTGCALSKVGPVAV